MNHDGLYQKLCSFENLVLAYKKARKGKTRKTYVIEFTRNLKDNLFELRNELLMHTYNPRKLKTFIHRDPKTRKISKSAFRDRIVHHAICNVIEEMFDRTFVYDSYANRKGKGTHNALKRFDFFKRKVSKNNSKRCYILKADIQHYFETVNHDILLKILSRRINNDNVLYLIKKIMANTVQSGEGAKSLNISILKGMPLGNLTSQFFANVYLNEFDQFVKHKLKCKYYIRYVDDFVIFHNSLKSLNYYKKQINQFLTNRLDIVLHSEKSKIIELSKGINFLGFKIFYHHKIVSKKNKRKFDNKLAVLYQEYRSDKINREKIIEKVSGWIAYTKHADSYGYQRELICNFDRLFPLKATIIDQPKIYENFSNMLDLNKFEFTTQKTLYLFRKGLSISEIAKKRNLKEGTIWDHIAKLAEYHHIKLKEILPSWKIKKILKNVRNPFDKLKEIRERLEDSSISYNEINCIVSVLRGKSKNKPLDYFVGWYKKTNCHRKCYYNKKQKVSCRIKFHNFILQNQDKKCTKNGFLRAINNTEICVLPENVKNKFISWNDFMKKIKM